MMRSADLRYIEPSNIFITQALPDAFTIGTVPPTMSHPVTITVICSVKDVVKSSRSATHIYNACNRKQPANKDSLFIVTRQRSMAFAANALKLYNQRKPKHPGEYNNE